MAGPGLSTNNDGTYADDPNDPSAKTHQQNHDAIHSIVNALDTTVGTVGPAGTILESNGTSYVPFLPQIYDQPSDMGYKSWSLDPRYLTTATSAPTAGAVFVQRLRYGPAIASGSTVGHSIYVSTAGSGTQALVNVYVGLYRADTNALIAVSGTQATAWSSTGLKETTLTTTADKPIGVDILAAFIVGTQSTTNVQLIRGPFNTNAVALNGKGPLMFATAQTGQASLPATLGTLTSSALAYYVNIF